MNVLKVMKESAALHDDNGDLIAKAAMIKARDSVAELIEITSWKPIDSAPKNASILISGGTYNVERYENLPCDFVTIAYWYRDHWRGSQEEGHDEWYVHLPTHWMPLPEPPKASP